MKLYAADSKTESERQDSDDVTITDTSTDNNTQPRYTHRIYQRNNNLKNTERVNRENDIAL